MFLRKLIGSFYSRALYCDIAHRGRGLEFTYLFYLETLVVGIALAAVLVFHLSKFDAALFTQTYLDSIITQIPEITLQEDGKVMIDRREPYKIDLYKSDIFNASGPMERYITFNSSRMQIADNEMMLVAGSKVFVRKDRYETKTYDLAAAAAEQKRKGEWQPWNLRFDSTIAKDYTVWLLGYSWVIYLFAFPFAVICFFVYRILQALFYGLIGFVISKLFRAGLNYEQVVRLAAVSATIVILLGWGSIIFALAAGRCLYTPAWFFFAVSMIYLAFAINSAKSCKQTA